ncbi:MAG: M28 family peptidase [Bacteroidales bacterium]
MTWFLTALTGLQAHVPDSLVYPQQYPQRPLHQIFLMKSGPMVIDTMIAELLEKVHEDSIRVNIKHLQDYGTRMSNTPQAFQAQDWLLSKLQGYGYNTYIQNLAQPSGSSGNVIATLTGCTYPDEYIVLGAHYDSYTGMDLAPGADDNASGTAGILEIARVLSLHAFDRSIILCLWAAEEWGLYGSTAYAQEAANNNMNILGYLNLDMCGYQYYDYIKTNVTGPSTAQALVNYYAEVCSLYLPEFQVTIGGNLPGSSDHFSFNQAGYMGIFPFEDEDHYSPYIHTLEDTLGLSVNSLPMAATYVRSLMATALEMAIIDNPGVGTEDHTHTIRDIICIPNPFTSTTRISFNGSTDGPVRLDIYNSMGQQVGMLSGNTLVKGSHQFSFDGSSLHSGIYYYRLVSGDTILNGKMVKGE